MTNSSSAETQSLGDQGVLDLTRQIDAACDELEIVLAKNGSADLASLLAKIAPEHRETLLRELVAVATEFYRSTGELDALSLILRSNPQIADEIRTVLQRASHEVDGSPATPRVSATAPSPRIRRRKQPRGLQIRCPHCSNHVELLADTQFESIDCSVCGSNFSLVDRTKATHIAETLKKIDRFEVVARLGVGGFGTVWKARDTTLDRVVAIKIPRHGQLSPDETDRFLREARAVAQLRHPNIVSVYEVGKEGDAIFIVSDFVRGVTLSDVLSERRLAPREAAGLCRTVAGALHYAHGKGIIHRDLKPSNIMIEDETGEPFLLDFGLAKREADHVAISVEGQILGTPAYMSPEQARGQSEWTDRRSDIYSLGVILFELLTGELPFRGNLQMQLHQRLREEAPNARTLDGTVPLDIATICAKCLEREPGRRYATSQEVAEDLGRFLDNVPVKARPPSPPERLVRWATRYPLRASLAGLVLLLAVVGPSIALLIERQRVRLSELVLEKDHLIETRDRENRDAKGRAAVLAKQLDAWEGRANPWEMWPPTANEPPKQRQIASLLSARQERLETSTPNENAVAKARRLLTLAALYEAAGKQGDARRSLLGAATSLEQACAAKPEVSALVLALADCYDRLARLTAADDREASRQWLAKALQLRREMAARNTTDPIVLGFEQDAELRAATASGFQDGQEHLARAAKIDGKLLDLWPASIPELYRAACRLTGRPALLDELPKDVEAGN